MLVCACSRAGTSSCTRCLYSNLHLGDVPPMLNESIVIAAYIMGASDYSGIDIRPEDINIEDLLKEIT